MFNQRSVAQILDMLHQVAAMVGEAEQGQAWISRTQARLREIAEAGRALPRRPRMYFEEWDDPCISGIRWVSELIGIAGGDNVFAELAAMPLGRDRIIADAGEVVRRAPDIIFGSWCGKKFRPERVAARPGWEAIPAVRDGELHEVKSSIILQPGPAALTDGLAELHARIQRWAARGTKGDRHL